MLLIQVEHGEVQAWVAELVASGLSPSHVRDAVGVRDRRSRSPFAIAARAARERPADYLRTSEAIIHPLTREETLAAQ